MKKRITFLVLLFSAVVFGQRGSEQYSIELDYGMSSGDGITGFSHIGGGFRYMPNEFWGVKGDFALDKFRTDEPEDGGTDYTRISVQGVYNIGRKLNFGDFANGYFNTLVHAGAGISLLQSEFAESGSDPDRIGNIIIGITPQLYLSDRIALTLDASYIFNLKQHYGFDGTYPNGSPKDNEFVGNMFTASVGISFYLGRGINYTDFP